MPSYAIDASTWRDYQPLLGSDMRLDADNLPAESIWAWRGLDVHLDRYGAPEADLTVIICHGGGGYGRLVAPVGRLIHGLGHAVVLPDLPGYGLTRVAPSRMRYPLWVDLVADLARAEREHSGRPVVLLGMSMGGMLALHAAAAAPAGTVGGLIATTLIDAREPATRAAVSRLPGARRLSGLLGLVPPNLRVPTSKLRGRCWSFPSKPAVAAARSTYRSLSSRDEKQQRTVPTGTPRCRWSVRVNAGSARAGAVKAPPVGGRKGRCGPGSF